MATKELQKQIKIHVSETEQDQIRLAAAFKRTAMATFCRELVLAEAERLTKGTTLPRIGK